MSRLRTRWLALFGGATLIALSMSTAFAGKPDGAPRGLEVSAFVHSLVGDVEDTEEEVEDETETEEETEVEDEEGAPSDHGQCVAAVAQDPEAVGPPNDNHGGAVSEAARVTGRDDEVTGDESDSEAESDGDAEESEESEDADSSEGGKEHGNGHGHGHGGDSSED